MEKIKIMTQPARTFLIENLSKQGPICDRIVKHFQDRDKVEDWLSKELGFAAFQETSIEAELPHLIVSTTNRGETEKENAKLLYTNLDIDKSFATDPRLWAGLACTVYQNWTTDSILSVSSGNNEINARAILEHFVFNDNSSRGLEKNNTLSRLWRIGSFFCRHNNILNKFYLLDSVDDINIFTSRCMTVNLFNNEKMLEVLIESINQVQEEQNVKIGRDLISKAVAYLNCLGGTYSLDVAPKEFLKEKLTNYFISILPQKEEVKLSKSYDSIVKVMLRCDGFTTWDTFCQTLSKDKTIGHKAQKKVKSVMKSEMSKATSDFVQIIKVDNKTYISLTSAFSNTDYKKKQKQFMANVIASLTGDAKIFYNIISMIKKYSFNKMNIIALKSHFKIIYGNDFDIENVIKNGSQTLVDAGIITVNGDIYTNKMIEKPSEE